jgi:hypothetical protein
MTIGKYLYSIQNTIFSSVLVTSYILYFLIAIGVTNRAPQYLDTLQYWVKLYIAFFLVIRFNGYRNIRFTDLDRRIAFQAGIFLLTTTFTSQFLSMYKEKIKKDIVDDLHILYSN